MVDIIRECLREVLADPGYRQRARAFAGDMAALRPIGVGVVEVL